MRGDWRGDSHGSRSKLPYSSTTCARTLLRTRLNPAAIRAPRRRYPQMAHRSTRPAPCSARTVPRRS